MTLSQSALLKGIFFFDNLSLIWLKTFMENETLSILIVEDDKVTAELNKRLLGRFGEVIVANTVGQAHKVLNEFKFDVAFFDLNLAGELDGLRLLELARHLNVYSIVVSGETATEVLEEAFVNGAKDFLNKPFNKEKLGVVWKRFENFRKDIEFENLINKSFITKSQSLTEELYQIKNLSFSDKPVFVHGETGTGKRVVGHLIRDILKVDNFIEINCSQYSDELFTAELFGHTDNAFTGARKAKKGLLELADNGIIFLDEIHALTSKSQKTLLKAIEEKEFYPLGSNRKVKSNFRVMSATCEDIHALIESGAFRKDLYARISTFEITLSPLRERREDIELLLHFFISKQPFRILINDSAMEYLRNYSWPQNTREIQDLVENWVVHGHRLISPEVLPTRIKSNIIDSKGIVTDEHLDLVEEMGLKEFLATFKKEIIQGITKRHNGTLKAASEAMNVAPAHVTRYLQSHKDKSFNTRRV